MRFLSVLLLIAVVAAARAELYPGFAADQAMLRKQVNLHTNGPPHFASSGEAKAAARRIFQRVPFLHKSRAEVLEILGDPKTISDFGEAASKEKDAPLRYIFADGEAGFSYGLKFRDGFVVAVEWFGLR